LLVATGTIAILIVLMLFGFDPIAIMRFDSVIKEQSITYLVLSFTIIFLFALLSAGTVVTWKISQDNDSAISVAKPAYRARALALVALPLADCR
jgi:hypothetical protein